MGRIVEEEVVDRRADDGSGGDEGVAKGRGVRRCGRVVAGLVLEGRVGGDLMVVMVAMVGLAVAVAPTISILFEGGGEVDGGLIEAVILVDIGATAAASHSLNNIAAVGIVEIGGGGRGVVVIVVVRVAIAVAALPDGGLIRSVCVEVGVAVVDINEIGDMIGNVDVTEEPIDIGEVIGNVDAAATASSSSYCVEEERTHT
jgi:hypothetical protein